MSDPLTRLSTALADRYQIERELGQGGMATVYLAHDVRHDRKVALKVLRAELSAILGTERFLHEIKTTAHLQHPHILPLHDSGEADGIIYYVMPYVEGESLRDRLTREKQFPVEEAVRIACEVADALDYAHRHGVVHRDIKPENILQHDGHVVVADFGIALAVSTAGGGTRLTESGMSLGTPYYMSPEQAMGEKEITPKSDVYALGCVLYEMLVGEPPFTGPTAQAIIARVVTEEPRSLTLQRKTIPPHVEAAVNKALEKLPADRFATASQFADGLTNPVMVPAPALVTPRAPTLAKAGPADLRSRLAVPLAVLAGLATVFAVWGWLRPDPPAPVRRFGLALPVAETPLGERRFAISPDGAHLAYVGPGERGTTQIWLKARDRYEATPLTGTGNVLNFTFSPDGQWIAFVQAGQLKKMPIVGGAAITLADTVSGFPGLAWLDDGTIVYIRRDLRELRRVPEAGGPVTTVWRSDADGALFPTPLPGSRGLLFTRFRGGGSGVEGDLSVLDLERGIERRLQAGAAMGVYVPTGHVVYVRPDGGVFAMPFSLGSLEGGGSPMPVLDSVAVADGFVPLMAVSAEGTLVMRAGSAASSLARYEIVWVDRTGRETPIDTTWVFRMTTYGANYGWALSPDGSRLAIGLATPAGDDIWVKQLPSGPLSRVTYDSLSEYRPRWTPDGRSLLFASNRVGTANLYRRAADGTGSDGLVLDLEDGIFEGAISPDGRWLLVRTGGTLGQVGGRDIVGLRLGVDSVPVPLVASTAFDEAAMALSPDGRWLAYESNETGRTEVFIRPFPDTDAAKWQVSTNGGVAPLWARSGRELFYVDGDRQMVVTTVRAGPSPPLGERRMLFRLRDELYLGERENYTPHDISPDGQHFVMARRVRAAAEQAAPLIVVENWFAELREKLAGR